ncbi:MAG: nucleotidyltransferase domain-containing protein [Thermodesulfobacteriota bacterium]
MEEIFSTKQRIKILQAIIYKIDSISVNYIANQLRLSKGLVSKYFNILTKKGILKRGKGKLSVSDISLVKAIKILLNLSNIDPKIFKKYPFVIAAGLYGSCAKGENTEDSDVDLWIRLRDVEETKIASLTADVNRKIKHAKMLILSDKRLEIIKEEDSMFYYSLAFGSIVLYGDKDALQI